jgi:hypothetical protein
MNLIYVRKVGYGVRRVEDLFGSLALERGSSIGQSMKSSGADEDLMLLRSILDKVLDTH